MSRRTASTAALAVLIGATIASAQSPAALASQSQQLPPGPRTTDPSSLHFEVAFPAAAHAGPVTGRVYVMISKTKPREPRTQIGRIGAPFFGRDVERLAPGAAGVDRRDGSRHPVWDMRDIPAGDYFVQAIRQRLLRVQARRRPRRLDARRSVGRTAVEPVAGQPVQRRAEGSHRSGEAAARAARRDTRHSAGRRSPPTRGT